MSADTDKAAVVPAVPSDAQILACFADTKAEGQGAYMLAVGRAVLALPQTTQPQADMKGIHSPFNACMFRDTCRALATPPAATPAAPSADASLVANILKDCCECERPYHWDVETVELRVSDLTMILQRHIEGKE